MFHDALVSFAERRVIFMKKYLNRIYTILLIILCVVLCVLQIQAGTLLSTGTIIRFVIIFIAYGLGMAYKKKS